MPRVVCVAIAAVALAAALLFGVQAWRLATTEPQPGIRLCHEDCGVQDDGKVCVIDSSSPDGIACYIK